MKSTTFIPWVTLILMTTGCSSIGESLPGIHGEEIYVTITAVTDTKQDQTGKTETRAEEVSESTLTRYIIQYTDEHGNVNRSTSPDGNFNLKLKYGERYSCSFWADNGKGYDASDLTAVTITEQPDMAAYYGNTEIQAGMSSAEAYSVTLGHAVARVDLIQTNDFAQAPIQLNMSVTQSYSLNVATSVATVIENNIEYTYKGIRQNSAGECIATAYYIAPKDDAALTVMTFSMEGEGTSNEISNVPLRRNCVTKVSGNFSDLYKSNVAVSIEEQWKSTYYNVEMWDGVSTSIPKDYANGETSFYITNPRELAWLAQESAKDGMTFEGYTIYIDRDIHLNNMEWTPIGLNPQGFKGEVIGQGYRINELKISSGKYNNIGLFASVTGCKISQLDVYGEITLDSPDEESNIGGIIGRMSDSHLFYLHSYVKINVTNGKSGNVGGITGSALDCYLSSIKTYSDISVAGPRMNVGGIAGVYTAKDFAKSNGSILYGNYHESGTISVSGGQYNNVGGMIGFFRGDNINGVSVDACYNNAPVTANNSRGSICGGIIGSCNGYTTSKLEIWACKNSSIPIISQSSDSFFGEIAGQAQVSSGYTLNLIQPIIQETVVIGKCYISDDRSQITYNSIPFTGGNGSPLYKQ